MEAWGRGTQFSPFPPSLTPSSQVSSGDIILREHQLRARQLHDLGHIADMLCLSLLVHDLGLIIVPVLGHRVVWGVT